MKIILNKPYYIDDDQCCKYCNATFDECTMKYYCDVFNDKLDIDSDDILIPCSECNDYFKKIKT